MLPFYELQELAALKVTVVPKAVEITGSTRSASQHDFSIDIGIQKKLGSAQRQLASMGPRLDDEENHPGKLDRL